ncbi:MAG TPA: LLM class flavin-dependent oxidoreductase [Thermomicrobiales bacterium]|nr:LLM class flavin-dependent oxidoreductase [Thermomicrobiales bacterium]
MRAALQIGPGQWTRPDGVAQTLALVQQAERLDYDTLWATEDPDGWDAFAVLASLGPQTGSIRLGSGVVNPYMRHPNLIAASIATLDRASSGRAFLGLGRGEPDWYRTAFDMPVGSPLKRVRTTIDLLHQWWQPTQTARSSREITVRAWQRDFPPLTVPPIYVAAVGPKMMALAGELGDGIRFNSLASPNLISQGIATARAAAIRADRDPDALRSFVAPAVTITTSAREYRAAIDRAKDTIASILVLPGMDRQLLGLEQQFDLEQMLGDVRAVMHTNEILARGGSFAELRAAGDLPAARNLIPDDLVLAVAAIGDLATVRGRLAALAGSGVTDCFIAPAQFELLQSDPLFGPIGPRNN